MTIQLYCTDHFVLPLPAAHRFPMGKYALLRERVAEARLGELREPQAATHEELTRAHAAEYVRRVMQGLLTEAEIRRIGFPWSPQMVERSRRSSGATISACRSALQDGWSANLAGGTHHAFRSHGEGYCVFNDSVIAARAMIAEGKARKVVVLDCDVHQGNGTAALTADDPNIYAFSIHGERIYPLRKERSDLDIGLEDGTQDEPYLHALENGLRQAIAEARADLAIYLAGADPYFGDRLGKLALTKRGLAERDRLVFDACWIAGIPLAVTMAGGYAPNLQDVVDIHFATLEEAARRCDALAPRG